MLQIENSNKFQVYSDQDINNYLQSKKDVILPLIAKEIGIAPREIDRRLTRLAIVHKPDVNGITFSSDGWKTFEILIYDGLILFSGKLANALAARMGVVSSSKEILETPSIAESEAKQVARNLMRAFWSGGISDLKGFEDLSLTANQKTFSDSLSNNAVLFVIAHEFGHVVIELCRERPKVYEWAVEVTVGLFAYTDLHRDLDEFERGGVALRWSTELGADLIGLGLLLGMHTDGLKQMHAYDGAEYFLILMSELEEYRDRTIGKRMVSTTHPPSSLRLSVMRMLMERNNLPKVLNVGKCLETLARLILR